MTSFVMVAMSLSWCHDELCIAREPFQRFPPHHFFRELVRAHVYMCVCVFVCVCVCFCV